MALADTCHKKTYKWPAATPKDGQNYLLFEKGKEKSRDTVFKATCWRRCVALTLSWLMNRIWYDHSGKLLDSFLQS